MNVDPAVLPGRQAHDLLISAIIPRPIAWVSSTDAQGKVNLAPFSMFSMVTWNPATLSISVVNRPDGTPKKTLLNIRETGDFVVNVVSEELAAKMAESAAAPSGNAGKAQALRISLAPSDCVTAPRVLQARVAFECVLDRIVIVGSGADAGNLILGNIKSVYVDDGVMDSRGAVDWLKLRAVGRLGGAKYCRIDSVFEIES